MSVTHTTKRYMSFVSIVLVFVFILSTEARADLYPFEVIQPANSSKADAMASQLSLDIIDLGGGSIPGDPYRVEFIFGNDYFAPYLGDEVGVITEVAFENGTLLSMGAPSAYAGTVSFSELSDPPAGTWGLGFDTETHFFSADSDTPKPIENAVGPEEALSIIFDLDYGQNWSTFMAALQNGFENELELESLRIGIHVQNLYPDGEKSDAYILTPIPSAVLLGILGLGVAGIKLRKFA